MKQSLFICIGGLEFLRNIKDCVNAFLSLLNTQYEIVLGRKGVAVTLRITFDKKDCFHLMGLQYLIDRPELNRDREKIFDKILMGDITTNRVESSDFYERIKERIDYLPLLEMLLDSNETVFKYNKKANIYSKIEADFLMKNNMENRNLYLFLSQGKNDNYYCRSFFPEERKDYTKNQALWTMLYKKKCNMITGKEIILYDKLTTSNKHKSLEERAMEFNGEMMLDGEYDWGEPVGRGKI